MDVAWCLARVERLTAVMVARCCSRKGPLLGEK